MISGKSLVNVTALRCGASIIALAGMAASVPALAQSTVQTPQDTAATPASDNAVATNTDVSGETSPTPNTNQEAQEADTTADDIIVTGSRQALQTSQNIKRNADTFVDTITATDIGAFPDKSVAEALQRVPGVTVTRFAAADDSSRFSADPSAILVRGLSQVRTEVNGRDSFSANTSRGLGFADITPDLLAGVDTYKNQTADLIEGGIAATVNLRTRLPFDQSGQVFQLSGNLNYGDRRQKASPEISGLYSARFDTGIGEFGVLASGAYSELANKSQSAGYGRSFIFEDVYRPGLTFIPESVVFRDINYDRKRIGVNLAAQWRDPSEKLLASVQYNRSDYNEIWRERGVVSYPIGDVFGTPADFVFREGGPLSTRIPRPAPGTPAFTFDDDGFFETGVLINQQTDFTWWGGADRPNPTGQYGGQIAVNDLGQPMFNSCYSWGNALGPPGSCGPDARGPDVNAVTRYFDDERTIQDASFNLKFEASERLSFNFDAQYVDATQERYDLEVGQYSFANIALDATGKRPRVGYLAPTNIRQSAGGLSNPNNYRYNHVMDHVEDSEGEEFAFRLDGTYDVENDWLNALKVGVRYADRDQTVRNSGYNWGNIANRWGNLSSGQVAFYNIDRTAPTPAVPASTTPEGFVVSAIPAFQGYPVGLYERANFGGDFTGGTGTFVFANHDRMADKAYDALGFSTLGVGQDGWNPICSNGGYGAVKSGARVDEIPGTCFTPGEINDVSEATKAAYGLIRFGGENARVFGLGIQGNVGLRYVQTKIKSAGAQVFGQPYTLPVGDECTRPLAPTVPGQPTPQRPVTCFLSADDIAFANGGSVATIAKSKFENWLPSFNIRIDLSDKWLVRFAASKAISRPDIGQLKNYFVTSASLPVNAGDNDPRLVRNAAGETVGVNPDYFANALNPNLRPIKATQFDLSIENYFAAVGSFSLTGFYKKFDDYIQGGAYQQDVTFNGVTRTVTVFGPVNGDGAKIYGAEAQFQRYFDFLPAPFQGFGVQTNFTYVKNEGIQNPQAADDSGAFLAVNNIEGLSKYAFNVTGLYDGYGLGVRVAYNWRSRFLLQAIDCCTRLPSYQKAAGFLDATVRYAVTKNFEFSLQAQNLLDTETEVVQQLTDAGTGERVIFAPNNFARSDRRFILGARVRF